MITWKWGNFIYPYVIFSWGAVMHQVFASEARIVVLITSILLAFRLHKC